MKEFINPFFNHFKLRGIRENVTHINEFFTEVTVISSLHLLLFFFFLSKYLKLLFYFKKWQNDNVVIKRWLGTPLVSKALHIEHF